MGRPDSPEGLSDLCAGTRAAQRHTLFAWPRSDLPCGSSSSLGSSPLTELACFCQLARKLQQARLAPHPSRMLGWALHETSSRLVLVPVPPAPLGRGGCRWRIGPRRSELTDPAPLPWLTFSTLCLESCGSRNRKFKPSAQTLYSLLYNSGLKTVAHKNLAFAAFIHTFEVFEAPPLLLSSTLHLRWLRSSFRRKVMQLPAKIIPWPMWSKHGLGGCTSAGNTANQ